ncbi:MAG: HlyC/CorC family transporter [Actinobacteria bacterium]|nr:HlyC/CorC family transporter [Actinomycetota bacterium]MBV8395464.1 HlyC/CorC family transporter [Actinomycetota bacterium]
MTLTLELLALLGLILLNAFFVAAEYGLVTSRRTRILELEHQGNRRARAVRRITSDPPRFIAAMQLGVTIASLAIGALGEQVLANRFDRVMASVLAVILALLIVTFLHVVVGELVPKGIALGHPERTALAVSGPVRLFFFVFRPFIWLLQRSTELLLATLHLEPPSGEGEAHSEAELRMLLSSSAEQGAIEHEEEEMLSKVFDFADKEVSDVMVPRPEVVALSIELPPEEALQAVLDSPYTRYPVFRGTLDEIVGILHVRDVIEAMHDRGIAAVDFVGIVRPAIMVPETKDLGELLAEFRRTKQHMAIVIDEYGAVEGIVTMEDLLEEIVGEIEDEFDLPDETVEKVDDDTIRIDGTFGIDDFNEQFDIDLPAEDFHTVGGFVFGALGRAAEPGDEVQYDGVRFHVDSVEGQRIDRITVTFQPWQRPAETADA